VLTGHRDLLEGNGHALDLACGRGQNALWLARLGYRVLGVDISSVALSFARSETRRLGLTHRVEFEQVDLGVWTLPEAVYDLVCTIRFLDRTLIPAIKSALLPGGIVIYATRHLGVLKFQPDSNRDYLLLEDELLTLFKGWEVLHYYVGYVEAEIIARKPEQA
jgi:SAM-dependent methyltransferase